MTLIGRWKERAKNLKRDIHALYLAKNDPRVPWYAKLLAVLIIAYALSPIDLIPDFIPVLGLLDELVLLPAGILLLLKMIPPGVMEEYRRTATSAPFTLSKNKTAAVFIAAIWVALLLISLRFVLG
jgi:uncharacterized membrane protein YkvA (DUF1232 family)